MANRKYRLWPIWTALSALLLAGMSYAMLKGEDRTLFMPGPLTAGHHQLELACTACHQRHAFSAEQARRPENCGKCHLGPDHPQKEIYEESKHGIAFFANVDAMNLDSPKWIVGEDYTAAPTCATCHRQIDSVHRKVIEGRLWTEEPHKIPACVDCHAPHKIRRVFYPEGLANKDCLTCHGQPDLAMLRNGESVSLYIDELAFSSSAHAGTACAQCHTDVTVAMERACATIQSPVDCSICHAEQVTDYEGSTHGTLHAARDPDAPSCQDCHAKHATISKELPTSPTYARNVPKLCGQCHRSGEQVASRIDTELDDIVGSYEDSVHGRALIDAGLIVTATCADCHGAHSALPADDPRSMTHPRHIAGTCGVCGCPPRAPSP